MSRWGRADDVERSCARLREVLEQTRHGSRRDFVKALGGVLAGAALPASSATAADLPVTIFGFGGVWKQTVLKCFGEPFTRKTGITVAYQEPYSFAKLRAMFEARTMQIDVVPVEGEAMSQAQRMNMIMPLDFNVIDRSVLDARQLRHSNAIGTHTLSYLVCYNKKRWPGEHHPASWADFWDIEKFPGRRALRTDPLWTIEAALKADGVTDAEFYPIDLDRAFRSLDRIKPHIKAWYSDNSLSQQLIEQEEVDLIAMMNGRAMESIRDHDAPFAMVWNEAIFEGGNQGWIAAVGCPNPVGAMKFLDVIGRPETEAVFAQLLYYGPQNPKAYDLIDPEIARLLPTYPANERVAHTVNFSWWADHLRETQRRFQVWLQS